MNRSLKKYFLYFWNRMKFPSIHTCNYTWNCSTKFYIWPYTGHFCNLTHIISSDRDTQFLVYRITPADRPITIFLNFENQFIITQTINHHKIYLDMMIMSCLRQFGRCYYRKYFSMKFFWYRPMS